MKKFSTLLALTLCFNVAFADPAKDGPVPPAPPPPPPPGTPASGCGETLQIIGGVGVLFGGMAVLVLGGTIVTGQVGVNGIKYGKIVKKAGQGTVRSSGTEYVPRYDGPMIDGNRQFSGVEERHYTSVKDDYQFVIEVEGGTQYTVDVSSSDYYKYEVGDTYRLPFLYNKAGR